MKRMLLMTIGALAALLSLASAASAAAPTAANVSATDLQGVSALAKGEVDPGGLTTAYVFQYVDQTDFTQSGFANATATAPVTAGQGSGPRPARAAISGLEPSTTYHLRLVATNSSGSDEAEATFATTQGFGFLPGAEGFDVQPFADGGGPAVEAGSHPYQVDFSVGLNRGGDFEDQPGTEFPDGDIRNLTVETPPGFILNPSVLPTCLAAAFAAPRSSPHEVSLSGENCPDETQVGTVEVSTARGGGEVRRFGIFNLQPPRGVAAQLGFAPYGAPVVLDVGLARGGERLLPADPEGPQHPSGPRHQQALDFALGHPLGRLPRRRTRQLPERERT